MIDLGRYPGLGPVRPGVARFRDWDDRAAAAFTAHELVSRSGPDWSAP